MATERKRTTWIAREMYPAAKRVEFKLMRQTAEDKVPVTLRTREFRYGMGSGVDPDMVQAATAHGWLAKLGDKTAQDKDAGMEERWQELEKACERFESGTKDWDVKGASKGALKAAKDTIAEQLEIIKRLRAKMAAEGIEDEEPGK